MLRQLHSTHMCDKYKLRGGSIADILKLVPKFLMTETAGKAIHGLVGLAGTAGLAYGAKKAIDAIAEKKAAEMARAKIGNGFGEGLGPAGYQHLPEYLINETPLAGRRSYRSKLQPAPAPIPTHPRDGNVPSSKGEDNQHVYIDRYTFI